MKREMSKDVPEVERRMTARVWVSQRQDEWEPAEVVHRTMEVIEVIMSESQQRLTFNLSRVLVVPRNPAHLEGTHDLITLQFLDEPNILHNLRVRHQSEEIYTNTGPIVSFRILAYFPIAGIGLLCCSFL
jgi:myosin heavy subunit